MKTDEINGEISIAIAEINAERVSKEYKVIKNILEAAHHLFKAEIRARPIVKALKSDDKEYLEQELQNQINKYKNSIDSLSVVTAIKVITVDKNFYDDKNIDYLKNNLRFIINIIYVNTAIEYGLGKFAKKELAKVYN